MKRRDFLTKSGQVLTMAALVQLISIQSAESYPLLNNINDELSKKRPSLDGLNTPMMKALAIGINAPSPHNTQSWKFNILSDTEVLLYVDENRFLPATDPTQRQIHLGAGCFIETLSIGAANLGYQAIVDYFPQGYSSKIDFGQKPVAKISLQKAEGLHAEFASYILPRQTNRKAYTGELITKAEFDQLIAAIGPVHARFAFIEGHQSMDAYKKLMLKAAEQEALVYETHDESRKMMRFSEKERVEKRDGLSIPQVGFSGMMVKLAENSLKGGDPKAWHKKKSIERHMKNMNKAVNSSKGIVLITTEANEIIDWIKTGRDFTRFGLALTKHNLYNNPHTQATQEYAEMLPLMAELNKLAGVAEPQKVQMILRIGRAEQSYYAYRKNLKDFMI